MTALEFQARVDAQGPFRASLEVTSETIDVTSALGAQVPDLAWEFVDGAGHYHAWTKDEKLPTLSPRVARHECSDPECDGVDSITHVCRICEAVVEPAYVQMAPSTRLIPGRSFWEATIYGVHLEIGMRVSVSFSTPADGRVRYFGLAGVMGQSITNTDHDGLAYVTRLYGDGELGRKQAKR